MFVLDLFGFFMFGMNITTGGLLDWYSCQGIGYWRKGLTCSRKSWLKALCFRRLFELVNELKHECLSEEFVLSKSGRWTRFPGVTRPRSDVILM